MPFSRQVKRRNELPYLETLITINTYRGRHYSDNLMKKRKEGREEGKKEREEGGRQGRKEERKKVFYLSYPKL